MCEKNPVSFTGIVTGAWVRAWAPCLGYTTGEIVSLLLSPSTIICSEILRTLLHILSESFDCKTVCNT